MIVIGKYGLEPDAHCWRLGQLATDKDGATILRNVTYPTDIETAMSTLLDKRLRDIDPSTFEEVLSEVRRFRADLSQLFTIKVEAA